MTITDFSILSLVDQLEILYTEGVYLGKRKKEEQPVILYQYGKWYVEIFYSRYRMQVEHTCCTDSTEILLPYLDQLQIDELL